LRQERNGKILLIDSGSVDKSPAEWALFTHHHPDQASGAPRLAATGTRIAVPASERRFFEEAQSIWDTADSRLDHDYNCRPDLLTLRDPVPVSSALKAGDVLEWQGLKFECLETPGHTDGSLTYLVELDSKRIAFTGDLIYAPGQIRRFARVMAAPHGRVHFCGEHTARANRGMEGAMESAERVALELPEQI